MLIAYIVVILCEEPLEYYSVMNLLVVEMLFAYKCGFIYNKMWQILTVKH